MEVQRITERALACWDDPSFGAVAEWKRAHPGSRAVGYFPVYLPLELIHAAGALPVGVFGGGQKVEIDHADSRVQSFVCSISRSTLELGLTERLACLDGMVFTSICDVARNLSGMWRRNFPTTMVEYIHYPQNVHSLAALPYYRAELERLRSKVASLAGKEVGEEDLRTSIRIYNRQRRAVGDLYALRRERPESIETSELYGLLRAGLVLPVEGHVEMLEAALAAGRTSQRRRRDMVRLILEGSFCEQPPLELLQVLEQAGCHLVDDDLLLHSRWFLSPVDEEGDPMDALVRAYLDRAIVSSVRHDGARPRGQALVERARRHGADGVIFCAAKFCEPALFDYVTMKDALEKDGIPYLAFEFEEKMGVFESIRTQIETFVESILFFS